MVMTKSELLAALQNEVQILLHLAGKVEPQMLDYRPTPKQRSTLELLRYLSMMGPTMIRYSTASSSDASMWMEAAAEADRRDFAQTVSAIAAQHEVYATLLAGISDEAMRAEVPGIDGKPSTRGAMLVFGVLCGCAAYRTQLFLYLKSCGREELGTMNLWLGTDAPAAAAS